MTSQHFLNLNLNFKFNSALSIYLFLYVVTSIACTTFSLANPLSWKTLLIFPALAVITTFSSKRRLRHLGVEPQTIKAALLILLIGLTALEIQHSEYGEVYDINGVNSYEFTRNTLGYGLVWLCAGAVISKTQIRESLFLASFIVALILISVFLLPKNPDSFFIDYSLHAEISGYDNFSHLGYADYLTFIFLFAYSISPRKFKIPYSVASLSAILLSGSRSAFWITLLAIITVEITVAINERKTGKIRTALITAITLFILAVIFFGDTILQRMDPTNFLTLNDESAIARSVQFEVGIERLSNHFFWGNTSDIIYSFGGIGAYMHNILSSIQFFGFLFFTLLFFLVVTSIRNIFNSGILNNIGNPKADFAISVASCAFINIFFSKSIVWFFFWFALGYCLNLRTHTKKAH